MSDDASSNQPGIGWNRRDASFGRDPFAQVERLIGKVAGLQRLVQHAVAAVPYLTLIENPKRMQHAVAAVLRRRQRGLIAVSHVLVGGQVGAAVAVAVATAVAAAAEPPAAGAGEQGAGARQEGVVVVLEQHALHGAAQQRPHQMVQVRVLQEARYTLDGSKNASQRPTRWSRSGS